jgi:hypothetical protein
MHPNRSGELDNQIAEVETFIERQRQLIAGLKAKGRPTDDAEIALARFVRAAEALKRRRQGVQDALAVR